MWLAAGAGRLADDPIHNLIVGRDPRAGDALASQPTPSRFENTANRKDLLRLGIALGEAVIDRHRHRLRGRSREAATISEHARFVTSPD